jgi:hypothetical protein
MYRKIRSLDFNKKPVWYRLLNKGWKAFNTMGIEEVLSKDKLIRAARKTTGLTDLGPDFWEEPLDRMLDSINREARLNPVGRYITRKRLENLLAIRLRAEYWFKKCPEILDQPLYPIYMIIGLQRTGTTLLQRLLARDPDTRSLKSWEAINPVPLNNHLNESSLRIRQAKISEKGLKILSPNFFAIHPVEHLEPEEDILLLDVSFMSTTTEATMHVPSYANWLEKIDQSPAYGYMKKLLKFLQYQRPAKRWILKSPHHLEFLDLTDQYFEKVQYLWTHRDLNQCLPSFVSMMTYSRSIFSDEVAPEEVRDHWLRKNGYMLSKAIRYRQKVTTKDRFMDIFYDQFIEEPMKIIKEIYLKMGEMNRELESRFRKLIKTDHKKKYGQHLYSMEGFGITRTMVEKQMQSYFEFLRGLEKNKNS